MTAWLPWVTTECTVVDCQFFSGHNFPQGVEVIVLVAPGIRFFGFIQKPCWSEPVERCWASVTISFYYGESLVKRSQSLSLRQRRFGNPAKLFVFVSENPSVFWNFSYRKYANSLLIQLRGSQSHVNPAVGTVDPDISVARRQSSSQPFEVWEDQCLINAIILKV